MSGNGNERAMRLERFVSNRMRTKKTAAATKVAAAVLLTASNLQKGRSPLTS